VIGSPLGAPAILPLPARGSSRRSIYEARRLHGVAPTTSPCGHRNPRVPAVDTFLSFVPSELALVRPGARFGIAAPPLSPLDGLTSRPVWATGSCGCERVERSVSGSPALLVFLTFRLLSAPFAALQGGRMVSPHAAARCVASDLNPWDAAQQQIPGLLPGTGALRSAMGDLVRSSVLV
jgi:hypothetical protein